MYRCSNWPSQSYFFAVRPSSVGDRGRSSFGSALGRSLTFFTEGLVDKSIICVALMNFTMPFKVSICSESMVTNATNIRSIARVLSGVHFEVRTLREPAIANFTYVWFLSGMNSLMLLQVTLAHACIAANIALKWFFAGVNFFVCFKIRSCGEHTTANITRGICALVAAFLRAA